VEGLAPGTLVELCDGTRCKVRALGGQRHLMKPKARKFRVLLYGQPGRVVGVPKPSRVRLLPRTAQSGVTTG
jgi:hypothetical protein